jgi:TetR/AcrR family transcriptional regulator, mexJK operon transcriptional repressor
MFPGKQKIVDDIAESVAFRRGPGGRPTQVEAERRHKILLRTAAELFVTRGLQGASIDAIARAAGVAKRFIYARYADKGELFVAAIQGFIGHRATSLYAFEVPNEPAEQGLLEFARQLVDLAVNPQNLAFFRMLIVEAPRYPSLAKLDGERNRHRVLGSILRLFAAYAERGEIVLYDAQMQAELFWILVVRGVQHRALILGPEEPAQVERRLKAAVRLFLDGCRPR